MRMLWFALGLLAIGLAVLVWRDDSGMVGAITTDQFARLVQLGAILLVISAGVLASRGRFGPALRHMAIWLAIVVALVAGYQFRYELQDVASAVTSGLVPGSPIAFRSEDGTNMVRLDRDGSGHFQVRGAVNGTTTSFLVDTGATGTVLTVPDAQRAGIAVDALRYDIPVQTANGQSRAARARIETLAVGPISRGPINVMVAQEDRLSQSLLGMDFLGTLSGIDVRRDRMVLHD